MEVFGCVAAVSSVVKTCGTTAAAITEFIDKYKYAFPTLAAMHTSITVIRTSLEHFQSFLQSNVAFMERRFREQSSLEQTFEIALAGCKLILTRLEKELLGLQDGMRLKGLPGRWAKVKFVQKDRELRELLELLKGQRDALAFAIDCMQVHSIAELTTRMTDLQDIIAGSYITTKEAMLKPVSMIAKFGLGTIDEAAMSRHQTEPLAERDLEVAEDEGSRDHIAELDEDYHAAISCYASSHPGQGELNTEKDTGDARAAESHAVRHGPAPESMHESDGGSMRGLAPSTMLQFSFSEPDSGELDSYDKAPSLVAPSVTSFTRRWLACQVRTNDDASTGHSLSVTGSQETGFDGERAIIAPNSEAFIGYIRQFMPALSSSFRDENIHAGDGTAALIAESLISDVQEAEQSELARGQSRIHIKDFKPHKRPSLGKAEQLDICDEMVAEDLFQELERASLVRTINPEAESVPDYFAFDKWNLSPSGETGSKRLTSSDLRIVFVRRSSSEEKEVIPRTENPVAVPAMPRNLLHNQEVPRGIFNTSATSHTSLPMLRLILPPVLKYTADHKASTEVDNAEIFDDISVIIDED